MSEAFNDDTFYNVSLPASERGGLFASRHAPVTAMLSSAAKQTALKASRPPLSLSPFLP